MKLNKGELEKLYDLMDKLLQDCHGLDVDKLHTHDIQVLAAAATLQDYAGQRLAEITAASRPGSVIRLKRGGSGDSRQD